jgi:hypothetical protein
MLPACCLPQINAKRDVEASLEKQYQRSLKVLHGAAAPNGSSGCLDSSSNQNP